MKTIYNLQNPDATYVIHNPTILNPETKELIVKIGRTGKEESMNRINSMNKETPVAADFEVDTIIKTPASSIVEKLTHDYLKQKNEHFNREFYTTDAKSAVNTLTAISEHVSSHSYVHPDSYCPISEDIKEQMHKDGFECGDYYSTPFSDAEYFPNKEDTPKGLNKKLWEKVIDNITK